LEQGQGIYRMNSGFALYYSNSPVRERFLAIQAGISSPESSIWVGMSAARGESIELTLIVTSEQFTVPKAAK
jgi:hypothetical protein